MHHGQLTKILHVASADGGAGAARASRRIHRALVDHGQFGSLMLVGRSRLDDERVLPLESTVPHRAVMSSLRRFLDQEVRLSFTRNRVFRSPCRLVTGAPARIEAIRPDIILFHWLGSRMLSIRQIGQLGRPTAWVLHDTWTFCGAEHYPHGDTDHRFIDGYRRDNRLPGEWGLDVNRRTWERKRRHWNLPIHLVAPSTWMAEQASRSAIAADWPVTVIPNPLDVAWWGGLQRDAAREMLGLAQDVPVLLYGAIGGDKDLRKGADLLFAALERVATHHGLEPREPLQVLTFGGPPGAKRIGPHVVRSVGRLDDEGLRAHYSAADVMVVPSRMDNLPQTAVEAIACGTPVVAFRTGGLPDIVEDGEDGRLVEPFSTVGLAHAIEWVLETPERHQRLSVAARMKAERWQPNRIARRYAAFFGGMLEA